MIIDHSAPILNPRRAPRLAIRCLVRAEANGQAFGSETEDLGPHGCQLVAPWPLPRGTPMRVVLASPTLPELLRVGGQVAWSGPHRPWRHGVAFGADDLPAAARWLTRLVDLHPELAAGPRAPAQLEPAARLHLGEPPRFLLDFTAAELAVLRQVQAGATAGQLRHRLSAAWEPALRALFSLLARRAVTLEPTVADPARAWTEPLVAADAAAGAARQASLGRLKLRAAGPPSDG